MTALACLDRDVRREYDQAVQAVPELVTKESPMVRFLRAEDDFPERAALRLALYWKYRKQVFGSDRWLYPMTITGQGGAMTKDDVDLFRSGYYVLLPCRSGGAGGVDILYDESRLPRRAGLTHTKILYYLTTTMDNLGNITVVHIISGSRRPGLDLRLEGFDICKIALPSTQTKKHRVLLTQTYEPGKEELYDYFAYQTMRALQMRRGHGPQRIVGHSIRDTIDRLQQQGLDRQNLRT